MTAQRQCQGYPDGHVCLVQMDYEEGRTWCQGCLLERQRSLAAGLPEHGLTPIGVVLEDFDAPVLACKCGGDLTMPDHEHSLKHRQWAWANHIPPPTLTEAFGMTEAEIAFRTARYEKRRESQRLRGQVYRDKDKNPLSS